MLRNLMGKLRHMLCIFLPLGEKLVKSLPAGPAPGQPKLKHGEVDLIGGDTVDLFALGLEHGRKLAHEFGIGVCAFHLVAPPGLYC